jgi:hypothetical protein
MSFILVAVPMPDMDDFKKKQAWSSFHTFAKMDSLKESEGVFYIDDTAWIFDTGKALHAFGRVIHQAHESGMQLHSFQLDSAMIRSHVVSSPQSVEMEEFLAS